MTTDEDKKPRGSTLSLTKSRDGHRCEMRVNGDLVRTVSLKVRRRPSVSMAPLTDAKIEGK